MNKTLKSPYPAFGGKSRVAKLIWQRFGDVPNMIEPFFGSGAVLLARPHAPKTETINDANAHISNFWRAVQADPEAVAHYADWPVSEVDLHARHLWLVTVGKAHIERLRTDPEYFDAKIAGWWVWGVCQWIGSGWCRDITKSEQKPSAQMPHLSDNGQGINRETKPSRALDRPHREMPSIGDKGRGILRPSQSQTIQKIPLLNNDGAGVHRLSLNNGSDLLPYLLALSERLRRVRVCCGDWSRVMGDSVTHKHGMTAVLLDPPYGDQEHVYNTPSDKSIKSIGVAADVRAWCLENGNHPLLRICLCGYAGEGHEVLEAHGWTVHEWKAAGGYAAQSLTENSQGIQNAKRERLWFSPACLTPQKSLFSDEPETESGDEEIELA